MLRIFIILGLTLRFIDVMGLWVPSSEEMLAKAEAAILRCIPKTTYSIRDVMIELPSKGFRLFGRSSAQNTHQ